MRLADSAEVFVIMIDHCKQIRRTGGRINSFGWCPALVAVRVDTNDVHCRTMLV